MQRFPIFVFAAFIGLCHLQSVAAKPVAEIVVGQSLPLTGTNSDLGRQLRLGADVLFAHINATGGIRGSNVRLVVLDDAYETQRVVRNTRHLVEVEQVSVLMGFPQALGVRDALRQDFLLDSGVPMLGPVTGVEWLREPGHPQVFHVRAGHANEAEHLTGHLITLGVRRIAMLHMRDEEGRSALDAMRAALTRKGLSLTGAVPFAQEDVGVGRVVQAVQALQPEAIVIKAPASLVAAFAKVYRGAGEAAYLVNLSGTSHEEVLAQIGAVVARGMSFAQVVPYPFGVARPLVREYGALLSTYGPMDAAPSYAGFEAFIGAKVLVEALRRSGATTWKPGGVAEALEQLGTLDMGEFMVRYSKTERKGSRYMDFTVLGSEGRLLR